MYILQGTRYCRSTPAAPLLVGEITQQHRILEATIAIERVTNSEGIMMRRDGSKQLVKAVDIDWDKNYPTLEDIHEGVFGRVCNCTIPFAYSAHTQTDRSTAIPHE